MNWISVKERLPDRPKNIPAVIINGGIWEAPYFVSAGCWYDCAGHIVTGVSHWLDIGPIPDPPKVDPFEEWFSNAGYGPICKQACKHAWNAAKAHKEP